MIMDSQAPRVGHKKSRLGCAQCKKRHVKVGDWRVDYICGAKANARIRSVMNTSRAPTAYGTE